MESSNGRGAFDIVAAGGAAAREVKLRPNWERKGPMNETGAAADAEFNALQAGLAPLWNSIGSNDPSPYTVVVVPSISYEKATLEALGGTQHFEERFLIMLMLLRDPRARVVYVTSAPVLPTVVDYYLHLLPGVIPSQARKRLFLVSTLDRGLRPLTEKLLERPRLLRQLRELIGDPNRAYMVPFNTTELEKQLALHLGVGLFGADPRFAFLGGKSGGRSLFAELGVPHPLGFEHLETMNDVAKAITKLRAERPRCQRAILKTNQGVSGYGNVELDLGILPDPGDQNEIDRINDQLKTALGDAYENFAEELTQGGAVVEERVTGEEIRSPSAQLMITPAGQVQLLSTHDQLLGGPHGQNYMGCKFPAHPDYALEITRHTQKIGQSLAAQGVIGRAAVDFVAVRSGGGWEPYAIEINLRQGGTTHPFLTLQFLTDGRYLPEEATFIAPNGRRKFFEASDHIESPQYRGFTPDDLFDIAVRHRLHFDHAKQSGVVFHMMSALPERGQMGLTAVADSPEEAGWLVQRVVGILDVEAKEAFNERTLRAENLPRGV